MIRIVVLMAVLLLVAVPASASGTAAHSAQAQAFLDAEHPWDEFWGGRTTDRQLLSIGYTICQHHRRGLSDLAVLQEMMGGPGNVPAEGSEGRERGLQRVRNAVRFIC